MDTKKINEITISPNETILTGFTKMDSIKRKLLIVMAGTEYIGLLSVGDIQRAIIKGLDLKSSISTIIRKDNIIVQPGTSLDEIKKLMLVIRAEFMPEVSSKKVLLDVYFWEDLFGEKEIEPARKFNIPVVIMAGGRGARLRPLTNVLPKPLIPIGDRTILEEIFIRFSKFGCDQFFISVNYKADLIKFYLKNENLPYKLDFFEEKKPMGTAGSLHLLNGKIKETFFVSNCDILVEQDYSEILDYHYENKNEITLVAALKSFPIPYGTVETGRNGQLTEIKEKPELTFKINSGMYVLEPHLLEEIPKNKFFHIIQLIESVRRRNGNIGVFPVSEKSWKDIGSWKEYIENLI